MHAAYFQQSCPYKIYFPSGDPPSDLTVLIGKLLCGPKGRETIPEDPSVQAIVRHADSYGPPFTFAFHQPSLTFKIAREYYDTQYLFGHNVEKSLRDDNDMAAEGMLNEMKGLLHAPDPHESAYIQPVTRV